MEQIILIFIFYHYHVISTTSNQINKQALSNMRMGPQTN